MNIKIGELLSSDVVSLFRRAKKNGGFKDKIISSSGYTWAYIDAVLKGETNSDRNLKKVTEGNYKMILLALDLAIHFNDSQISESKEDNKGLIKLRKKFKV